MKTGNDSDKKIDSPTLMVPGMNVRAMEHHVVHSHQKEAVLAVMTLSSEITLCPSEDAKTRGRRKVQNCSLHSFGVFQNIIADPQFVAQGPLFQSVERYGGTARQDECSEDKRVAPAKS